MEVTVMQIFYDASPIKHSSEWQGYSISVRSGRTIISKEWRSCPPVTCDRGPEMKVEAWAWTSPAIDTETTWLSWEAWPVCPSNYRSNFIFIINTLGYNPMDPSSVSIVTIWWKSEVIVVCGTRQAHQVGSRRGVLLTPSRSDSSPPVRCPLRRVQYVGTIGRK